MKHYKQIIIAIITFIGYLLLSFFQENILFFIDINDYPNIVKIVISLIYELFLLLCIMFIYLKEISVKFKDFKNNFKYYIDKYLKYWFLNLGLMIIVNIIISSITDINNSTNQEYIIKLLNKVPIYTLISTILIAPLTEELIFRLTFRKIFTNDILFILISGLIFGSMHLIVATNIVELLYIIPYSIPGFIFAYTLKKSNNIFVPISLHVLHNTVMMILQLLITFI